MPHHFKIFIYIVVVLLAPALYGLEIKSMRIDGIVDPVMVRGTHPRFGWAMKGYQGAAQTAYAIEIDQLMSDGWKMIWRSGQIAGSESQWARHTGEALQQGASYRWRVRAWDEQGKPSAWSKWSLFHTAPDVDSLQAQWIGAIRHEEASIPRGVIFSANDYGTPENRAIWAGTDTLSKRSILLRKSFQPAPKRLTEAIVYISGLGHYELTLNGEKVGDGEFAPLWSDYAKTVYFNAFDVTARLRKGENVIGVLLGNGFYNEQGGRYTKLKVTFGAPTLFFRMTLRFEDGSEQIIRSDESWKYAPSPIVFNSIYGGEDYDARLEQRGWDRPGFREVGWRPVVVQSPPAGQLTPQLTQSVKIMERYEVQQINKLSAEAIELATVSMKRKVAPSAFVADMGQNLAGFPMLRVSGQRGDTITLITGESLTEEGAVNQRQTGRQHLYTYVLKGDREEIWHPRFSYYGFRYIQVEGAVMKGMKNPGKLPIIHQLQSCFLYNAVPETGTFESSSKLFNDTHRLIEMAVKSNMQAVFTDCPHREKLGWLEQIHLNGPGLMFNYDLAGFAPKIMQDIADAQQPDGRIYTTAPVYTHFEGWGDVFRESPEWSTTFIVLPWLYYDYYGDDSLIRQYYTQMRRYVDYMATRADAHIVSHGLGDWYDYGDFKAGFSRNTPVPLVATAHYYYDLTNLVRAAAMVGNQEDVRYYSQLAERVKSAFNQKFFDAATKSYGTGSQASLAIPLYLGLVDDAHRTIVLELLESDIRSRGNRLTTGDVGNRYLFQTLADNGLNELMYAMHHHDEPPGYGFQLKFGATTLTEQWDPRMGSSWNHFMMGHIDEWFYASLAGLRPLSPGFREIRIQPHPVGELNFVKSTFRSFYGDILVHWEKRDQNFRLNVEIPVNCSAQIYLPGDETPITVKSGRYSFEKNLN